MRRASSCIGALLVTACAGNVETRALTPEQLGPGAKHKGVVFYLPEMVKLTYAFTTRVDEKGNIIGSMTDEKNKCISITQKEEVSMLPDVGRPMLLTNASGALSAGKFSVTLDKGLLTGVNAEPTQKTSDLLTAAAAVVGAFAAAPEAESPACNASPMLVSIKRTAIEK
jgi:hypothetical protein